MVFPYNLTLDLNTSVFELPGGQGVERFFEPPAVFSTP